MTMPARWRASVGTPCGPLRCKSFATVSLFFRSPISEGTRRALTRPINFSCRKCASPRIRKLAGVNTEAQEHVFAWARWLVHVANPMKPVRHRVFFLLLCLARNEHRGLGARPRASRPNRNWNVWRGAFPRRPADGDDPEQPAPEHAAVPAAAVAAALLDARPVANDDVQPSLLLNLRDNKLHRLAAPLRISCGATLPKRWRYLSSRDEVARSKLCLRNGCFSPGADF